MIGRLPPIVANVDDPELTAMVEVEVGASTDGWFLVSNAQDNELLTGADPRPMFEGSGWVSGRRLAVKSQADKGHRAPDAGSPVVLTGRDGATLDTASLMSSSRLVGCRGSWALVEFGPWPRGSGTDAELSVTAAAAGSRPGSVRAWLDRICALQETSCSGF